MFEGENEYFGEAKLSEGLAIKTWREKNTPYESCSKSFSQLAYVNMSWCKAGKLIRKLIFRVSYNYKSLQDYMPK